MQIIQNVFGDMAHHYKPAPQKEKFGHLWARLDHGSTQYEKYCGGEVFFREEPTTLLIKSLALLAGVKPFFSLATSYHFGKTVYETGHTLKEIWARYKLDESEGGLWKFLKIQESSVWEAPMASLSMTGKVFAGYFATSSLWMPYDPVWGVFSLANLEGLLGADIGYYALVGFAAYAVYHPQYPRVLLSRVESILHSPIEENEKEKKEGIHYRAQELLECSIPISTYLGWQKVELPKEEQDKKDE